MSESKKWQMLLLLMIVYLLSFLDRQIISILAEDIKRDLDLSDTQLGLLTGLAFAVFYATLGIPVARLAERHDRISILSICVAVWSAMTAAGAAATNFFLLALTRAGVGIGEAGSVAPAHSLISDAFKEKERSKAMAVFQLGVPLGILAGFFIGGTLSAQIGWRMTLVCVGLPGVALAVVLRIMLRDPRGRRQVSAYEASPDGLSFAAATRRLFSRPGYVFTLLGATFASAAGYAIIGFLPPFLIRSFGMPTDTVGVALSMIIGIGGGIGLFLGGAAADRFRVTNAKGPLWICVFATLASAPMFAVIFISAEEATVFWWLIPPFLLHLAWMGPNWAMVQSFAPEGARATASALVLLSINLIGLGLGPLVIGIASDSLAAAGAVNPLGKALLAAPVMLVLAAIAYGLATLDVRHDPVLKGEAQNAQ